MVTRIQFLDETICISIRANALGKGMNPYVRPTMDKKPDRLGSSALVKQPV